eukprot:9501366-Pyramimonas_sp.AAC.1
MEDKQLDHLRPKRLVGFVCFVAPQIHRASFETTAIASGNRVCLAGVVSRFSRLRAGSFC